MENYMISFETYVEVCLDYLLCCLFLNCCVSYQAVLLTFQLSVGVVKMFHFQNKVDSCTKLVFSTETGQVLKSLGLFELGKTENHLGKFTFSNKFSQTCPKNRSSWEHSAWSWWTIGLSLINRLCSSSRSSACLWYTTQCDPIFSICTIAILLRKPVKWPWVCEMLEKRLLSFYLIF